MEASARTMIVMDVGTSRFQCRAGALIWAEGHILIHRAVGDTYWSLPGGRIELHESGAEALAREIQEEIGCAATIGRLRFMIENFFELEGRRAHEIGFYFDATLSRPLPFHESRTVHRVADGDSELEFRWALPSRAVLDAFDLKPSRLKDLISGADTGIVHLVHREP